jgi:hypothetical protein
MLSFIFLSDGPCNETSWHVNDDKNQWWSRRDALARIISAASWSSPNQWNRTVREASLLFRVEDIGTDGSTASTYCSPVIIHSADGLVRRIAVPTERSLLKVWKDSFSKAEHAKLEMVVGSPSFIGGVLCSLDAWKESMLVDSNHRLSSSIDVSNMDKRELLVLLQKKCGVEFLRKHGLNGPETLILKKKNRESVLQAFHDWCKQGQETNTRVESNTTSAGADAVQASTSYDHLVATCTVVLGGMLRRASHALPAPDSSTPPSGYLLFLHEDYPQELNVFTSNRYVAALLWCVR